MQNEENSHFFRKYIFPKKKKSNNQKVTVLLKINLYILYYIFE